VIQNLGYSVSSLLAGLGIGGLAVALAAQESLGNFFGSISIIADRPFKVGDWIQVGDRVDGDVEEIGLRSTRVRTWSKSQLTIPNKVMAGEIIENWSRMPKRRVKQIVGVTYETKPEDMGALVEDIRELLRADEDVHQEFILVNFTDFGASSLDILVYYFTKTTKWLEHMDVRQRINLKIMKAVNARGLSIAFPTRTVYFEGDIASQMASNKGRELS
jgi:MscS family membrane protein